MPFQAQRTLFPWESQAARGREYCSFLSTRDLLTATTRVLRTVFLYQVIFIIRRHHTPLALITSPYVWTGMLREPRIYPVLWAELQRWSATLPPPPTQLTIQLPVVMTVSRFHQALHQDGLLKQVTHLDFWIEVRRYRQVYALFIPIAVGQLFLRHPTTTITYLQQYE